MDLPFEPGTVRARWAMAFLALSGLLQAASAASYVAQARLLSRYQAGVVMSRAAATANDDRQRLIAGLIVLMLVPTAVTFLLWLYRAHMNIVALGAGMLQTTAGWAVGSFFVPVMNMYYPAKAVGEIWKGSHPANDPSDPSAWTYERTTPLIGFWWAFYLLGNLVVSAATPSFLGKKPALSSLISGSWWAAGGHLVSAAAAVLIVIIIFQIDRRQLERCDRIDALAAR